MSEFKCSMCEGGNGNYTHIGCLEDEIDRLTKEVERLQDRDMLSILRRNELKAETIEAEKAVADLRERYDALAGNRFRLQEALETIRKFTPQHAEVSSSVARIQSMINSGDVFEVIDEALECEHGKRMNDYCEPCGRIHGG